MSELDINKVLELFSALDIAELNYKDKDRELVLRKAQAFASTVASAAPVQAPTPAVQTIVAKATEAPSKAEVTTTPAAAPKEDASLHAVKSPLVGTFYRAPAPGQPDFVQIGKRVSKGDTICIVEAMKVMNTIEADVSGEIVEILVESGAIVEFGTPLLKIKV